MTASDSMEFKDSERGNFEMVNTDDVVIASTGRSKKVAKYISWANINYNVGNKRILTECWGKVS